ncbi:MAG: outer membrane protein assembly factor [Microscillaceae bacterium]|nr:outer membrane protein assembly factor [Microscillaceae bacterium]
MQRLVLVCCVWLGMSAMALAQDTLAKAETHLPLASDTGWQNRSYLIIEAVVLEGNKQTKDRIILRELDLKIGDTLRVEKADSLLQRNRNKVFNTNLFITVDLILEYLPPQSARLRVKMQERWYVFPFPIFELSDRNFNEWINNYNADLSRTNYGMRFVWENFRGRNEKVELLTQFGFLRKFELTYRVPYLDRRQKHGLEFSVAYSQNKSVAYRTLDHKLSFVSSPEVLRERVEARLGLSKRNAYYSFHNLDLRFRQTWVADTVTTLNPNYFLGGQSQQRIFSLSYSFRRDMRDIFAYPLRGSFFQFNVDKSGLGLFKDLQSLNTASLALTYAKYQALNKKLFFENYNRGFWLIQRVQPYANAQALGYGDNYLRGYENFVIDGQSYLLSKNTLKFRLFEAIKKAKFIPIRQFRTIPIAMYLTTYWDMGYVRDQYFTETSNQFSNKFIFGYGVGLDLFTYYNMVINFNYSFNQQGVGGFFINFNGGI